MCGLDRWKQRNVERWAPVCGHFILSLLYGQWTISSYFLLFYEMSTGHTRERMREPHLFSFSICWLMDQANTKEIKKDLSWSIINRREKKIGQDAAHDTQLIISSYCYFFFYKCMSWVTSWAAILSLPPLSSFICYGLDWSVITVKRHAMHGPVLIQMKLKILWR